LLFRLTLSGRCSPDNALIYGGAKVFAIAKQEVGRQLRGLNKYKKKIGRVRPGVVYCGRKHHAGLRKNFILYPVIAFGGRNKWKKRNEHSKPSTVVFYRICGLPKLPPVIINNN